MHPKNKKKISNNLHLMLQLMTTVSQDCCVARYVRVVHTMLWRCDQNNLKPAGGGVRGSRHDSYERSMFRTKRGPSGASYVCRGVDNNAKGAAALCRRSRRLPCSNITFMAKLKLALDCLSLPAAKSALPWRILRDGGVGHHVQNEKPTVSYSTCGPNGVSLRAMRNAETAVRFDTTCGPTEWCTALLIIHAAST